MVGGGSAAWLFLYGIYYWATQLRLDSFSSTVVYFGYLSLLTILDFLCTASIGFLASYVSSSPSIQSMAQPLTNVGSSIRYWAVRRLYSAIRID